MAGVAVPGERLGSTNDFTAGSGTYECDGYVYACLTGLVKKQASQKPGQPPIIRIARNESQRLVLPETGSIVTCKVTSINSNVCKVSILCVGAVHVKDPFRGIVRKEEVRATEKDKVEMYKCFRPGDIIRAKVISLGDAHSYILSTAENELGVIFAESEAGAAMVPISWCHMQCPKTKAKENRKVAKVHN